MMQNVAKIIFVGYESIFSFNENKFVLNKRHFHYITPNLYNTKHIFIQSKLIFVRQETFILCNFFIQVKYFL